MMTKCLSSKKIAKIAHRIHNNNGNANIDKDDLCQSGWVGLLESMKTSDVANDTYQYTSVLRHIKRESCKFWFVFDVPEKILRKFRRIFLYLKRGDSLDTILVRLKIT